MEQRRLGRTEHRSSLAILGGAVFFKDTPDEARPLLDEALAQGLNHLDIAPGYGQAERAVGPHMADLREKFFLAGKTSEVTRSRAQQRLEKTLDRLGVNRLDLYQAHGVTSIEDLDSRSEAFEVLLEARDQGVARFVGVTGHDLGAPRAHLEAVRRYDLDTVMFPVYPRVWADPDYRSDAEALLRECEKRDVGVMAIKAVARRPWGDRAVETTTWYEPVREPAEIERGVRFALSTPGVHAFCTPSSREILPWATRSAREFQPMSADQRDEAVIQMQEEPLIFPLRERAVSFIKRS